MKLTALAVSVLAVLTQTATAETQAERDARRTSYIVGVTCSIMWAGQPGQIDFSADGVGEISHHEDGLNFEWWVREDKYCFQFQGDEPNCSTWPSRDIGDEKNKIVKAVTSECF